MLNVRTITNRVQKLVVRSKLCFQRFSILLKHTDNTILYHTYFPQSRAIFFKTILHFSGKVDDTIHKGWPANFQN